ncbi:MAG: hypothetical protein PHS83_05100 [Clostridia bacterium]|jgi:hypothetical protein|nr:hypothetical protein [Clostridia bacterium]MDD4146453.1 hypothetical protein [Clostridia bacterium]MDD4665510.1 hypothetical protein [Clostridia bacterium]
MKQVDNFMKKLKEEIEKRIKMMQNSSYNYVQRFNKRDLIYTVFVGLFCILGLIWGIN